MYAFSMNTNCLVYRHTHFFVDKIRSDRLLGSQRRPNKQYSAIHLIVYHEEKRGILAIQNLILFSDLLFSQLISIEVVKNL